MYIFSMHIACTLYAPSTMYIQCTLEVVENAQYSSQIWIVWVCPLEDIFRSVRNERGDEDLSSDSPRPLNVTVQLVRDALSFSLA